LAFNGEVAADTIQISEPLPPIVSSVEIDGRNCPNAGVNRPCVGVNAPGSAAWIFDVERDDTTIDNLSISGGVSAIVVINGSSEFKARGNWVGIKLDGSAGGASQEGIQLGPASDKATIGGVEVDERNLIANNETGLSIFGAADTEVQGNWFG